MKMRPDTARTIVVTDVEAEGVAFLALSEEADG